ncbi:MAG: radical SAM protein [Deltaproteobacteria bacterium]|jgi:radical SAM protein with 4Fe4S-binding SPASM domain|nr:radical SAM protein [Deltaproteobacteria bacterium]
MGGLIVRYCRESDYLLTFNQNNGFFLRMGKGGKDPFYNALGPELLDISITNYCARNCGFCYRASHVGGLHMAHEDYEAVMGQARKLGVLQVALGGGNPNEHPEFVRILETTRRHNIVPSYTTNGQGMTAEIYEATKKYCGALAVSWYPPYADAREVVRQAGIHKIKTNVHFMLSLETIPEAVDLLDNESEFLEKINAVVFLNYKPVHSSRDLCLTDGPETRRFFESVKKTSACKIGFDSCMVSYLTLLGDDLERETVDFCEAGRFSAFVSEDMRFYPCSFLKDMSEGVDLGAVSLGDAWRDGAEFQKMRGRLKARGVQEHPIEACGTCSDYDFCRGGCQIFDVNRCRPGASMAGSPAPAAGLGAADGPGPDPRAAL